MDLHEICLTNFFQVKPKCHADKFCDPATDGTQDGTVNSACFQCDNYFTITLPDHCHMLNLQYSIIYSLVDIEINTNTIKTSNQAVMAQNNDNTIYPPKIPNYNKFPTLV